MNADTLARAVDSEPAELSHRGLIGSLSGTASRLSGLPGNIVEVGSRDFLASGLFESVIVKWKRCRRKGSINLHGIVRLFDHPSALEDVRIPTAF